MAGSLAGSLAPLGCALEPEACVLELQPGDLVVTEIRGPQDGPDSRGEWFELHNATDRAVDLAGLRVVLTNLEGSLAIDFLVRDSVPVEPAGHAVLGSLPLSEILRPEVDYSFNSDFRVQSTIMAPNGGVIVPEGEGSDPRALFSNAKVELFACEQRVESVVYTALPTMGTYSLDGALTPDAEDNDDVGQWCTDATAAPEGGSQLGLPGSPGEANPPCA